MSDSNPDGLGELIQAYVRSRWDGASTPDGAAPPGEGISAALRERVDVLGFDSDELLSVPAHDVLATLERLEREAAREDARIAVATIHARVAQPSGAGAGAGAGAAAGAPRGKGAAASSRREQRARPRRRQSSGNGAGRAKNGRAGNGSRTRGRR